MNVEWKVKSYFLESENEELAIVPKLYYGTSVYINEETIPEQYHGTWICHGKNAKGDFIFKREYKETLESSASPHSPPPASSSPHKE